jgi:hypothetical protein
MNKMKYLIPLLVFLMILIIAVPATSASSNSAAEARWLFEMDFVDNQIHGDLTITVEFEDPKQQPIVETIELECTPVGTLQIADEQATFSGDDYIRCAMPDLVQTVAQLTDNEVILAPYCFCKENPWVAANLTLDTTPHQPEPTNPIFYRPDLQFDTPLLDTDKAAMRFHVGNQVAYSTRFPLSGIKALWAEYVQTAPDIFEPAFIANGQSLSSTPAVIQSSLALSSSSTLLYIGYSPASGNYLEGILIDLVVDPACRGYG